MEVQLDLELSFCSNVEIGRRETFGQKDRSDRICPLDHVVDHIQLVLELYRCFGTRALLGYQQLPESALPSMWSNEPAHRSGDSSALYLSPATNS